MLLRISSRGLGYYTEVQIVNIFLVPLLRILSVKFIIIYFMNKNSSFCKY